jgi:hypothetical protein
MKLLLTLICIVSIGMTGCVHNRQWRTQENPLKIIDDGRSDYAATLEHFNSTLARTEIVSFEHCLDAYDLFVCEFDDAGIAHEPEKIQAALDKLKTHLETQPALIVTFAHGWKHNAKADDDNIQLLRRTLLELARREHGLTSRGGQSARKIFCFYLGWRGRTTSLPIVNEFTVWSRKSASDRVGTIGAPQFITEIIHLYQERRDRELLGKDDKSRTRSIAIGQSFGTVVIGQSYLPWITSYVANPTTKRPADLVLLINPAFEALRFEPLMQSVQTAKTSAKVQPITSSSNEPALLATITSTGDKATKLLFPISRSLKLLTHKYRNGECARILKTVGHYEPYRTDTLHMGEPDGEPSFTGRLVSKTVDEQVPGTNREARPKVYFKKYRTPGSPLIRHIYADTSIIKGHGLPTPNGSGSYEGLIEAIKILIINADMSEAGETQPSGNTLLPADQNTPRDKL